MSLATVLTRAAVGIEAPPVIVEVHLANGLPSLAVVGLPEAAVKESKDRVRAALQNSGFEFPVRRITVNLAPADLPKEGGRFDLPIALGILAASGQLPITALQGYEFIGELALSGELRPVRGVLPFVVQAHRAGHAVIVPSANGVEAALYGEATVLPAAHLLDVCAHLLGRVQLPPQPPQVEIAPQAGDDGPDLRDVRGQHHARRALELAASGGHNLIFYGPPGTGKTMLACRLPTIMPQMTAQEALESATVASISNRGFLPTDWARRPYRHPHHTASSVALVGGGNPPRPGEVSLAHHGVLFLDELPEFDRHVLEVMREPLESGEITISRASHQAEFPARFQLVAAMNPCPCGYLGHPSGRCHCSADKVARYRGRISGPLLDRIDLQVEVPALSSHDLHGDVPAAESSACVQLRVIAARERQISRQGRPNAQLSGRPLAHFCQLDSYGQALLDQATTQLGLSARAHTRIRRVARTIADLANREQIEVGDVAEAIGFRRWDRR